MNYNIVTMSNEQMKNRAKVFLKNNWGKSALCLLILLGIYMGVCMVAGTITMVPITLIAISAAGELGPGFSVMTSVVSMVITYGAILLIAGPLLYGACLYMRNLTNGVGGKISDLFAGFKMYGKLLGLTALVGLILFAWMLIALIPMMGIVFVITSSAMNGTYNVFYDYFAEPSAVLVLIYLLSLILYIPYIIASLRYSLVYLLLVDNKDMSIMELMRESKRLMKGNKWKLFLLMLSIVGAIVAVFVVLVFVMMASFASPALMIISSVLLLLCTLGFLVGMFWLYPYLGVSFTVFYTNIIGETDGAETPMENQIPIQ